MRLQRLKLCNFRCFGDAETTINFENLTLLIGANSSGKTAVLQALVKLFSNNPAAKILQRSDFHVPKGKSPKDLESRELYIEAILDFPELNDKLVNAQATVPLFFREMTISAPSCSVTRCPWIAQSSPTLMAQRDPRPSISPLTTVFLPHAASRCLFMRSL